MRVVEKKKKLNSYPVHW